MDKIFIFDKLSWELWQKEYRPQIRTMVDWDNLGDCKTGLSIVKNLKLVYVPRYTGRNFTEGKMEKVIDFYKKDEAKKNVIVRAPALDLGNKYFILDGFHRITSLKPYNIILDTLKLKKKQYNYFIDLLSPGGRIFYSYK